MKIPRRIRQLLARVRQASDDKHVAARSGVRRIDAETYEEFAAECDRILHEEPPAPGYGYLFTPEPMTEEEWLAKHPPDKQKPETY